MPTVLRVIAGARSAVVVTILSAGVALSIGACGGSSPTDQFRAPVTLTAYRSCLARHGVRPLFTGGRFGTLASRIDNPKYTAVVNACGMPAKLPLSAKTAGILRSYTACIAGHGYRLPTPNTSGSGPVFPPGTDRSRGYRTAAAGCAALSRALVRGIYGVA